MKMEHLKRVVCKEELVNLTGDAISAIILNQFLYWSQRTRDADKFRKEELDRDPEANIPLMNGWIYKSADDLAEELMDLTSRHTLRRRIIELVEAGWIDERNNPKYGWDRTLQYRPNLLAIQRDLQALGYSLEGYPLIQEKMKRVPAAQNEPAIEQNAHMIEHSAQSKAQSAQAIPETTTEITSSEIQNHPDSRRERFAKAEAEAGVREQLWEEVEDEEEEGAERHAGSRTYDPCTDQPQYDGVRDQHNTLTARAKRQAEPMKPTTAFQREFLKAKGKKLFEPGQKSLVNGFARAVKRGRKLGHNVYAACLESLEGHGKYANVEDPNLVIPATWWTFRKVHIAERSREWSLSVAINALLMTSKIEQHCRKMIHAHNLDFEVEEGARETVRTFETPKAHDVPETTREFWTHEPSQDKEGTKRAGFE